MTTKEHRYGTSFIIGTLFLILVLFLLGLIGNIPHALLLGFAAGWLAATVVLRYLSSVEDFKQAKMNRRHRHTEVHTILHKHKHRNKHIARA